MSSALVIVVATLAAAGLALAEARNLTELDLVLLTTGRCDVGRTVAGVFRNVARRHNVSGARAPWDWRAEPGVWWSPAPLPDAQRRLAALQLPVYLAAVVRRHCSEPQLLCGPAARCLPNSSGRSRRSMADQFDLLLVHERLDESLLLLQLQLGLSAWDVVYVADNYNAVVVDIDADTSVDDQQSVYSLANERLDHAAATLPDWSAKLAELRALLERVEAACTDYDGPCLWPDRDGCAFACFDRIEQHQSSMLGPNGLALLVVPALLAVLCFPLLCICLFRLLPCLFMHSAPPLTLRKRAVDQL